MFEDKSIMLQSLCKLLIPPPIHAFSLSRNQNLRFLQLRHFSASSQLISKSNKSEDDNRLFTIDYLTKTCGLPPERAESVSKYLNLKTRKRADSVISLFKNQGFTKTQISWLIRGNPGVLQLIPDKNLLPKFEFLKSLGLSTKDIVEMISRGGSPLLDRSLEKKIVPLFTYISSLLQSNENTSLCIKRFCNILIIDLENVLIPNVDYLKEVGVPHENVIKFFRNYPRGISYSHDKFRKAVDAVKSMGFDPMRSSFALAVYAFCWNCGSLGRKMEIYKSFGLSDTDVLETFRKYPSCMLHSEDKILKSMDFLVNRMGFETSLITKRPNVVFYSLEKRIIPRCNVYQALLAKGMVPKNFTLALLLESPEEKFICTFVKPFESQVPGLMKMYKNSSPVST